MLNKLREKNPGLSIESVESEAFALYGRVLTGYDVAPILDAAKKIPMPESGSVYVAGVPEFESLKIAEQMEEDVFGCLPSQTGYCYGYSSFLNAMEWHTCSEVNIAVTPLVLMLATRFDLKDNKLDASQVKAFYVPAGTAIEVYATTLHFCPCQVEETGFGCVVGLLKGTNLPHEEEREDKFLFRKNKWLIAHNDNAGLLARGAVPGISGENYQLHF